MKILLLGATGETGRFVLEQALAQGMQVVAVVRNASKVTVKHADLTVMEAPLSDKGRLLEAMRGAEAVVSTLGVARATPHEQPSKSLPMVLDAMREAGVRRYVGISGAGIDVPGDKKGLSGHFISWLVKRMAPEGFEDKVREYELLRASDLDWTLARAPRLVSKPPTGKYRVEAHRSAGPMLARGDVADFLLKQVGDRNWVHQAPFLAS